MSYTLRGRLESRFAALLLPLLAATALAAVLREWWPLELAALMAAVGLALDVSVYHRLLAYQPGWLAVPLGLLELGAVMALVRGLAVEAPLAGALALFAGAWLVAQVLGHAVLPLARITYGEDGGELGRSGSVLAAAVLAVLAFSGGVAWGTRPPTITLAAGVHEGPLVLDSAQTLVGEPGAVVRGGIVVTADGVTIRGVRVVGGAHGIEVDGATDVVLDQIAVSGATLDGINVRRGQVEIRRCLVHSPAGAYAQGIDISFAFDLEPSLVEGCTIVGGLEGIVANSAQVEIRENRVIGTSLRGITMTEMSMGSVEQNDVEGALGVGIFCGDYSECDIAKNVVTGTRPDLASGDRTRRGYGIVAHYGAKAELDGNVLLRSPGGIAAFLDATIHRD